jgi:ubiquinone/menaquinone biosynthesis C-methylase UbiE
MDKIEQHSIKQFTKWAKNYDNPLTSLTFQQTNSKIVKLLNPKTNSSLLDVGCGSGILIKKLLLLNRNMKLYGLDITPKMVEITKMKFKNDLLVEITLGSAIKMPYKDNSFDYVTCASSFHHHPDPTLSIKEMVRVLKPGGRLIILDGCIEGIFRKTLSQLENIYHNEGKTYKLTNKEMYELFKRAELIQIKQFVFSYFGLITEGTKKDNGC